MLGVAFFADQDFSCAGFALEASGEINHVANGRVVLAVFGAEPADASITGCDAYRGLKREAEARAQMLQRGP
jgi:hypothetical protein